MTELAATKPTSRVLEVGTGTGYQAAVLSVLVREVYTIEIVEPLAQEARVRLQGLGYANVFVRAGDGYRGWPEKAPSQDVRVDDGSRRLVLNGSRRLAGCGPRPLRCSSVKYVEYSPSSRLAAGAPRLARTRSAV